MGSVRLERNLRWGAVAVGVAALVCTPALVGAATQTSLAGAGLSPQQVVAAALRSGRVAHQGLVQVDGQLDLPALPFGNDATALLSQSTRVRTWWVDDTRWRTDTLSATGQQEEFAAATGTLGWDYERDTVSIRPATPGLLLPRTVDLMPPAAARTMLTLMGPAEQLRGLPPRRIAGRVAAGAEIVSGEPASSVSHLDLWVDPASGLPLELDVYVRGSSIAALGTRFLDLSLARPDPAVVAPVLSLQAHWTAQLGDLVSFIQASGDTIFPTAVAGLPQLGGPQLARIPTGIASYGSGFARAALLQLPRRLVPRIESVVGASGGVDGGGVAVLRSPLLQLALLELPDGTGYLLAGALTSATMDAAVRSALAGLTSRRAAQ